MANSSEQGSLLGKIAAYTELLDKDPRSTIFVPLSEVYRQMGMLDEAVDIAKKGIMENPAFPAGYVACGRGLAQQGLTDEAAAEFDKALTLDRKNLAALKSLAKIRIQQGSRNEARNLLEQASSIKPKDASVAKMLAVLAKQRSTAPADATSAFVTVASGLGAPSEKSTEPISTATIAEIYIRQGFPEKALKVYRDLLRADPQNEQLRAKLIALKSRLADSEADAGEADVYEASVMAKSEPSPFEVIPTAVIARTVISGPEPDSLADPSGRSIVDIFSGWLNSINRRREAHVQ